MSGRAPLSRDLLMAVLATLHEFWQRGDCSIRVEPGRDGAPLVIGVQEEVRPIRPRTPPPEPEAA